MQFNYIVSGQVKIIDILINYKKRNISWKGIRWLQHEITLIWVSICDRFTNLSDIMYQGPCRYDIIMIVNWTCGGSGPWWRHYMETLSALLSLCEGNPALTSGSHRKRTIMQSFDVSFVVSLNSLLNKQSSCKWFETPWRDVTVMRYLQRDPAHYTILAS